MMPGPDFFCSPPRQAQPPTPAPPPEKPAAFSPEQLEQIKTAIKDLLPPPADKPSPAEDKPATEPAPKPAPEPAPKPAMTDEELMAAIKALLSS